MSFIQMENRNFSSLFLFIPDSILQKMKLFSNFSYPGRKRTRMRKFFFVKIAKSYQRNAIYFIYIIQQKQVQKQFEIR